MYNDRKECFNQPMTYPLHPVAERVRNIFSRHHFIIFRGTFQAQKHEFHMSCFGFSLTLHILSFSILCERLNISEMSISIPKKYITICLSHRAKAT